MASSASSSRHQVTITLGRSGQVLFFEITISQCAEGKVANNCQHILANRQKPIQLSHETTQCAHPVVCMQSKKCYNRPEIVLASSKVFEPNKQTCFFELEIKRVVKRRAVSDIDNDDGVHLGRKRSVRDRLGNNMVGSESYDGQQRNKRRQIETNGLQHGDNDCQVGRDDLRLKLMKKGLSSNGGAEQNGVDLREKLSRKPKNIRRYDARGHVPESRSRYDGRDKIPELRSRYGMRERLPEPRTSALPSRIPSARSMDDLLKLDSSREAYSSWSGNLRHRSPEKLKSARRDMSPSRTYDHIRSMPPIRSAGTSRTSGLITRDAPAALRTQPYAGKSTISIDTTQPANGVASSATVMPTAPVMPEVPLTVTGLLNSLGLEKYVFLFHAEEVDMAALSQMGDSDLKEIGVPMGPRKKILQAVAPYSKRRR
ncbi:hypothetical protein OsI_16227 [Oryza sativa Indica Group]|uniref:SAM domain-containing protein n=1 Tax=Oryza sativa subsp. indica TaxID=39946 RepID=A2XUE7_ORYSI|nr:hypothetical protein OsI_16227 [Oryza sativa Indica Group]